jgi:hypothetical protein
MQDVLDHCQEAENEQDSKQKPLARSLLQFASVHGLTRRGGQRHRWKIRSIRVGRWLSNASLRIGIAGRRYNGDMLLTISASEQWVDWPEGERSGVHRIERPATGSYARVPVENK